MNVPQKTPSKRRRNQRANRRQRRSQKQGDFGTKVSPPVNPPDTVAQPWWPLTISSIRQPGEYTIDSFVTDFQNQLNADQYTFNTQSYDSDTGKPFRIQVRFMGVDVWNLTGRILSLTVWELPEQNYTETPDKFAQKDQLGSWVDCGGPSAFPAIGYRYPASHHRRVYRPDPRYKAKSIVSTIAASGDRILIHLHCNWKADGFPKFTSVQQPHLPLLKEIRESNKHLVEINESILEKQSDRGNAIVKGASVAAQYVIPIVTGDQREPQSLVNIGSPADVARVVCQKDKDNDLALALLARIDALEQSLSELSVRTTTSSPIEVVESEDGKDVVSNN